MRTISDTIARLAAMQERQGARPKPSAVPDRLSPLAHFGSNPGGLGAKFYHPDLLPANAPLVVVLHGCLQNAAEYDHHSGWSRLADEAGFALLYPEQQRGNNPNLCFNWFQPQDVKRDAGEALSIRQMIEAMVKAHGLDRRRIFVTGLSAGGAMAAAMLASYPEIFAGGSIIAGLAYGSAKTIPEAFDRMRGHGGPRDEELQRLLRTASAHSGPWPKISIWQGTSDQVVDRSNAIAIAGQWRGVHQLGDSHALTEGKNARQVWSNGNGEAVLEINMVSGMGHGTPIDKNRLGSPGPYMLDVGISSTEEIARFWGIADPQNKAASAPKRDVAFDTQPKASPPDNRPKAVIRPAAMAESPRRPPEEPAIAGVRGVIENALRAAGLMR